MFFVPHLPLLPFSSLLVFLLSVWEIEALPILASTKEGGARASAIDGKKRGLFYIDQKKKGFSFKRDTYCA